MFACRRLEEDQSLRMHCLQVSLPAMHLPALSLSYRVSDHRIPYSFDTVSSCVCMLRLQELSVCSQLS